ncbi:MAG: lysylphosphatidylglycerol synthase transmembrane domain-containing protein [Bacteroidales bacterium]|nr:flippase-like domain-containing protein [Bacteroidales bacterium]MDD2322282.1 lysylphosphatidylglycerol synthase transmembrane domain-containing protein [Bacteroidales bacterium]MDD3010578.1 lysylphosphatidylglycerol synthase transmembrane domain-containing protein [Bacteroidales bacterium]MDD3961272.1 lysylphosphatidylglycerol synthase transmembrane domain-containing protein [Bacteroidales bacterium]MDY0286338.1 lysylphosphatidylglycerol synthase transmembrane domain-containing protein [Bac
MRITESSNNQTTKKQQVLRLLFFLALGFFFIWLFLRTLTSEEKHEIGLHLRNANYSWILLSVVFGLISNVSRAARWRLLLQPMGFNPRYSNMFLSVLIAYFANLALPRLGEVSRCLPLTRYEKIPFEKSFGTVVAERAFDMIIMVLLFVINILVQFSRLWGYLQTKVLLPLQEKLVSFGSRTHLIFFGVFLLAVLALLIFIMKNKNIRFISKIRKTISGFTDGLKSILYIKKPFAFILHTLNIWFMYLLMTLVVFQCLPETAQLGISGAFSVLMFGSIGIILVQGGIGIYPAIVAESLTLYGILRTTGYAMGWLLWSGQTAMIILAGLIAMILFPLINRKKNEKHNPLNA